MEVVKITPRGYCYGVVDAITLARDTALNAELPRPVYILGLIVHNRHVVERLKEDYGIISLDGPDRLALLESIEKGTVIFTAHGVAPEIKRRAEARGLVCVDATCPDVTRTHVLVRRLVEQGYRIIYVGKRGHPECEGVIGEAPDDIHLVESKTDIDALDLPPGPVALTTQTTLSQWDTHGLINHVRKRYPNVEVYNEICLATQQRQEAAVRAAGDVDLVIVVGDSRSNNSNRLVQVVKERAGKPAYLVESAKDIDPDWLQGTQQVAVTAGSSTPTQLTRQVIRCLENWPEKLTPVPEAERQALKLAQSHYENFTVMSWLLPRAIRQDVANLYAFCRTVDDLGDEAEGDRLTLLDDFQADLHRCYSSRPVHPVLVALQQTIQRHTLPAEPLLRLIAANRRDQQQTRYETWDDLLDYCTYSANPVGRLYLHLIGYTDGERQSLSDATCSALQLVNFWQDIPKDAQSGRIYIPLQELSEAGLTEDDVLKGHDSAASAALIQDLCGRTEKLFSRGWKLLPLLPWPHRYNVRLFSVGGMTINRVVLRQRDTAFSHRPILTRRDKWAIALRAMLPTTLGGVQ